MTATTAPATTPAWYPHDTYQDEGWFAVPADLRPAYTSEPDVPPPSAVRAFTPGAQDDWLAEDSLPDLPEGVSIAERAVGAAPPLMGAAFDPDARPRPWARVAYADTPAGLAAWHHREVLARLRAEQRLASRMAAHHARFVATCPCGVEVPAQGAARIGGAALCPVCALVAEQVLAAVRASEQVAGGRTRWDAVSAVVMAQLAAGSPAAVRPAGPPQDLTRMFPDRRPPIDLPPRAISPNP
jgi:hypothetical protein